MARKVGQIISRGDRRWLIRAYLGRDHETNKRKYHNRTIHGPLREAQAYLTRKLRERDLGRDLEGAKITLNEYLDRWLETAVKPRVREKTRQDYSGMLRRYVRPSLGERLLTALRSLDLFRAVSETLMEIAADRHRLGARIGILAVLHAWNQRLQHHPHLHCLVPAGGLAPDQSRWIACRPRYFLPAPVLSCMFRGKMLAFLKHAYDNHQLRFPGTLAAFSKPGPFHAMLSTLRHQKWVVYAKAPFGGPEYVLKYLAPYTHRVALANGRLLDLNNGQVSFKWRDSRDNNRIKVMSLDALEFIRRFLLHVLPCGFVKIRHFGLLANRNPRQALALCRHHLKAVAPQGTDLVTPQQQSAINRCCPKCKRGTLHVVVRFTTLVPATDDSHFAEINSS